MFLNEFGCFRFGTRIERKSDRSDRKLRVGGAGAARGLKGRGKVSQGFGERSDRWLSLL